MGKSTLLRTRVKYGETSTLAVLIQQTADEGAARSEWERQFLSDDEQDKYEGSLGDDLGSDCG